MTIALNLLFALAAAPAPAQIVPQVLSACADSNEFSPFTFSVIQDGKPTSNITGYNVDFLNAVLAPGARSLKITLLPWNRCLALSASGKFDIILDVAGSPKRERDYHLIRSHYTLSPIYLYSQTRPVPVLRTKDELLKYKRCEILGWDYSASGVPNADDLVTRPSTVQSAMAMLRNGRCDLMVYDLELVHALQQVHGQQWLKGLAYHGMSWLPRTSMHLGVSRSLPYAAQLVALLNKGVETLQKNGEAARLLERYVPK